VIGQSACGVAIQNAPQIRITAFCHCRLPETACSRAHSEMFPANPQSFSSLQFLHRARATSFGLGQFAEDGLLPSPRERDRHHGAEHHERDAEQEDIAAPIVS